MRNTPSTRNRLTAYLTLLLIAAGCAAQPGDGGGPDGTGLDDIDTEVEQGAFAKSDAFYEEYAAALTNDATGNVNYGSCEDVEDLDIEAYAHEHGTTVGEAREEMYRAIKLAAFRKVSTLKATLQFMKSDTGYEEVELPDGYLFLEDFDKYYDYTDKLNDSLGFQQEIMQRRWEEDGRGGDPIAYIDRLNRLISQLEEELGRLESKWFVLDRSAHEARKRNLEQQILSLKAIRERVDSDRAERRRLYQNQLKAAAYEIRIIQKMDSWFVSDAIDEDRVWDNANDGFELLTMDQRLSQLYAQFPILAQDDSLLFLNNDLAERIFKVISPDRSAASIAEEFEDYVDRGSPTETEQRNRARRWLQNNLHPKISQLVESDFSWEIQEEIDWALDHWTETLDEELSNLPSRDGKDMMEYADLVDGAIAMADPSMQPLWLQNWCQSEARARWLEIGKTVFYIGAGIGALVAGLFGQVQIAVPLGMVVTTAFAVDAIHSAIKASEYKDAQAFFWLTYDEYSSQERRALMDLIFAAVGVIAEGAVAVKLVKGWKSFQAMKGRLTFLSREYDDAQRAVNALKHEIRMAEAAGRPTRHLYTQLDDAVRALENVDDVSRIASRTLSGVHSAESTMGRIEVASLMSRFKNEAEALAFFETITRQRTQWGALTEMGYRSWLKALKESRRTGAHVELPAICR